MFLGLTERWSSILLISLTGILKYTSIGPSTANTKFDFEKYILCLKKVVLLSNYDYVINSNTYSEEVHPFCNLMGGKTLPKVLENFSYSFCKFLLRPHHLSM